MKRRTRIALTILLSVLPGLVAAAPIAVGTGGGGFTSRVALPGGRRIYVECRGRGSPTVILGSGLRDRADIWSVPATPGQRQETVLPAIARFTRVCAYDRPGTTLGRTLRSRSDPVRMPRTARDAVADLHALLRAARISGP